jgi:hypothetical protein
MEIRSTKMLALFDILGSQKRMETLQLDGVLARYLDLADFVDDMTGSIVIRPVPDGEGGVCPAVGYLEVGQSYFSDTFVVWADYEPLRLPAFLNMCSQLMCYCVDLGIPLRGGIGVGDAYMDKEKNIFLGPALIDAYLAESAGQWVGVSVGNTFSADEYRGPFDPRTLLPYRSHQNPGREYKLDGLVLDWPRLWRTQKDDDLVAALRRMDTDPAFTRYYDNAVAFAQHSAYRHNWWEKRNSVEPG